MNNPKLLIENKEDFALLVKQAPIVIVTTYRGLWCPFCKKYLKDFNKAMAKFPEQSLLIGVSVDDVSECVTLKEELGLDFNLFSDVNLVLHNEFNVTTGKGHGKEAYLQPSVFIFHNGEKVFEWIQTPKLMNLGGAIHRISISDIIQRVSACAE